MRDQITRRNFIKGVIAGGAVASGTAYMFRGSGSLLGQTSPAAAGERLITLMVNGQARRVDVMKQETLAMTLRYKLGLTGTKLGCDRAECGACTVLIDDVPHYSCSVLTHTVRGKKITTIEGLAENGTLTKVQQAWVEHDVPQCGYCQSGMIMAVSALLKEKPKPTDADIDAAITNICRCGTFQQVRLAIHAAAKASA